MFKDCKAWRFMTNSYESQDQLTIMQFKDCLELIRLKIHDVGVDHRLLK